MADEHIIIIGAGAAGLMAAKELSAKGKKVTVLEARSRVGGRIHTVYDAPFATHAEMGAEFVHGDLPVTLGLLKEAGIHAVKTGGEMWQAKDGTLRQEEHQIEHWELFESKLKELEKDVTIDEFLGEYFAGEEYEGLRKSVRRYAAGYDTADPAQASAVALREEWMGEDEGDQYRPGSGYQQMTDYLADTCIAQGCVLRLDAVVQQIQWLPNAVAVTTDEGVAYHGTKVIVTVPAGVLQAAHHDKGAITFSPALPETMEAIHKLGMGAIIKILMQFEEAFWESEAVTKRAGKSLEDMLFVFSEEQIPAWWTQSPDKNALLTGWLGGPPAEKLKNRSDEAIADMAVKSLAGIFNMEDAAIRKLMTACVVVNWTADVYSRGSYSYAMVGTEAARNILNTPVANTIYFAGEAMDDGPVMGTVESALRSGVAVAKAILR